MSRPQWVVVVRPDPTQEVLVIGPFRSLKRAEAVHARIVRLEEKVEPWSGWAPTIERLRTGTAVIDELKLQQR